MVINTSLYQRILNFRNSIYQATMDIDNPFRSEFDEHSAIDKCCAKSFQFEKMNIQQKRYINISIPIISNYF